MTLVLGVDGCPHGWCAVALDTTSGTLTPAHVDTFAEAVATSASTIAIDVPIGLLDVPGGRDCDRAARKLLGRPRMTSVFSPPSRAALVCATYEEACAANFACTERKISRQSFGIGPKIREVDEAMTTDREARVYEAHPEAAFAALAGHAMTHRKSKRDGRGERWAALRRAFSRLPAGPALPESLRRCCDLEDYVDALVLAWTAARIRSGEAISLPADPPRDSKGLRMAIWY
jgi:predicted RNase H-like nuclease